MARRRLDPGLIALAGSLGLPHRAAAAPVPGVAPPPPIQSVEEGIARNLVVLEQMHVSAEEMADEVFSTAHRAKGREWPSVALHNDFPDIDRLTRRYGAAQRSGRPTDLRAALEEWHVLYVAATRAIDTLVLPQRLYDWLG